MIVHIGDLHIAEKLSKAKNRNYLEELDRSIDYLIARTKKYAQETQTPKEESVLLIAGDVFNSTQPSKNSLDFYARMIDKIEKSNIFSELIITTGNHDCMETQNDLAPIDVFTNYPMYSDLEITIVSKVPIFTRNLLCFPYIDNPDPLYIAGVIDTYKSNNIEYICMHTTIEGSSYANGHIPRSGVVPRDIFPEGIKILLGHVHKPQNIKDRFFYPGPLIPSTYGENSCGFYIHDKDSIWYENKSGFTKLINKKLTVEEYEKFVPDDNESYRIELEIKEKDIKKAHEIAKEKRDKCTTKITVNRTEINTDIRSQMSEQEFIELFPSSLHSKIKQAVNEANMNFHK